jgi:hypothetical protein
MAEIYAFTASLGHNGLIDVFAIGDPGDDDSGTAVFPSRAAPGEQWPPRANVGIPDLGAIGLQSVAGPDRYGHILARAGGREAAKDHGDLWFRSAARTTTLRLAGAGPPPARGPGRPDDIRLDVRSHHRRGGRHHSDRAGPRHADGRIDLVGTANDIGDSRDIFYRARPASSTAWAAWSPLGDNNFDYQIVAAIARDGGLEVITPVDVIPEQGVEEIGMQHKRRHPDGTWTSWSRLGRPQGGFSQDITPVLILGPGGALELFAVSAAGAVWHNTQPAAGTWSGWAPLATRPGPSPVSPSPPARTAASTCAPP